MPIFGGKKDKDSKASGGSPSAPQPSPSVGSQNSRDFAFDEGATSNSNADEPFERKMLMTKEPAKWTVSEVGQWLGFLGLGEHRIPFIQNSISGVDLLELTEKDLHEALGIAKLGDRKKIMKAINNLKQVGKQSEGSRSEVSEEDNSTSVSETSQLLGKVTVKVYYKDDIRTFEMDAPNYEKLVAKINEEYKTKMLMKYQDKEGELVTVNSDDDVKRAFTEGCIKLYLRIGTFLTAEEVQMLERMLDPTIIVDKKGYIVLFNRAAENAFGYTKERVYLKNVSMLMTKPDSKQHKRYIKNYLKTGLAQVIGKSRTVVCKASDGSTFTAKLSVTETKEDGHHYFTGTLHKLDSISDSNPSANFVVFDNLLDATIVINDYGVVQFANKAAEKLFGWTKKELTGQNVRVLMPEPFSSEHDVYISNYKRSRIAKFINSARELPIQLKSGQIVPAVIKLTEHEVNGRLFFIGVLQLSESKKAVKTMLEMEREVLNNLLLPAVIIDINGIIQAFNGPAQKTFGYELKDVIGRNITMIQTGTDKEHHDQYLKNYAQTGKSTIIGLGRKVIAQKKDGSVIPCKLWVSEKHDENKKQFFSGVLEPIESTPQ